jgi:hypothetical protein
VSKNDPRAAKARTIATTLAEQKTKRTRKLPSFSANC